MIKPTSVLVSRPRQGMQCMTGLGTREAGGGPEEGGGVVVWLGTALQLVSSK